MARNIDHVFHSATDPNPKTYPLASGYISETTIRFENERVTAVIQASGRVEFYNMDDERIAAGNAPPVVRGKEVYEEVGCQVEGNSLTLRFPIYQWVDHYPHCDGEYDRWSTKVVGFHPLTLDLASGTIR